jgi:muconolactone D-isomerase
MDTEERSDLFEREWRRGSELRDSGVIVRIWRIPGQIANVGIWNATDATVLHDFISSLPLFPWMSVRVTPLAVHPLERDLA